MGNFLKAFLRLEIHEGGYSNHPSDSGRATMYGISQRSYPDEDIDAMTLDRAMEITRVDYWNALQLDQVKNQRVAEQLLDGAFNAGQAQAGKWAQRAVNLLGGDLKVDGVIGPKSLETINTQRDQTALLFAIQLQQLKHYEILATDEGEDDPQKDFIRGWLRRILSPL